MIGGTVSQNLEMNVRRQSEMANAEIVVRSLWWTVLSLIRSGMGMRSSLAGACYAEKSQANQKACDFVSTCDMMMNVKISTVVDVWA